MLLWAMVFSSQRTLPLTLDHSFLICLICRSSVVQFQKEIDHISAQEESTCVLRVQSLVPNGLTIQVKVPSYLQFLSTTGSRKAITLVCVASPS